MAGFKTHLTVGSSVGVVASLFSYLVIGLSMSQAGVVFILGSLGGVLPDLDSDTGKPVQFLFGYLRVIIPAIFLSIFSSDQVIVEELLLTTVVGFFVIRYLVSEIFMKFTVHRGIIHSIPAAIICGELTYLFFYDSVTPVRIVFAFTCAFGFLSHLILDEIWSFDPMGLRIKNSFGTAVTFSSNSVLATAFIYLMVILLMGLILFLGYQPDPNA